MQGARPRSGRGRPTAGHAGTRLRGRGITAAPRPPAPAKPASARGAAYSPPAPLRAAALPVQAQIRASLLVAAVWPWRAASFGARRQWRQWRRGQRRGGAAVGPARAARLQPLAGDAP